jgi:hypothetical protein
MYFMTFPVFGGCTAKCRFLEQNQMNEWIYMGKYDCKTEQDAIQDSQSLVIDLNPWPPKHPEC